MAKYEVTRDYYDGRDIYHESIGFLRGSDLEGFVIHLLHCGYEGKMKRKHGRFSAIIDPGWLDHHGNHRETYYIDKVKKHKTLSPADWKEEIKPFAEQGYVKTKDNVYIWEELTEGDDSYESDSDVGAKQADEDNFEAISNNHHGERG